MKAKKKKRARSSLVAVEAVQASKKCTTVKHLYSMLAIQDDSNYHKALADALRNKIGDPPMEISARGPSALAVWSERLGCDEIGFSYSAMSAFGIWRSYGCQVFSLDEATLDLLACTEAPPLTDLAPSKTYTPTLEGWKLPYPVFAFELPYSVSLTMMGSTERYTVGLCCPYWNEDGGGYWSWQIFYTTPQDFAERRVSSSRGNSVLLDVMTNLCIFLSEGGSKVRAGKRIGYDRRAKKAGAAVNIWKVAMTTDLPLGMAREFLESGEPPSKSFRIGKRFMVRGHWRNQRCGKSREEIRRIWIRPHIKGPAEGEAWSRVYQVKND